MKKSNRKKIVAVVGAGLAGAEAAWQLAERGHLVRLFDMLGCRAIVILFLF